jgi:hypothetical protein
MLADAENALVKRIKESAIGTKLRLVDTLQVSFGIACVARNAAGQSATRKGDGKIVGLYELAEYIASLMNGFKAGEISFYATSIALMSETLVFNAGLQVAIVRLEGNLLLNSVIDVDSLADFLTMNSQFDIEPFAGAEEHQKWTQEPPDHSTSAPELTEELPVQQ